MAEMIITCEEVAQRDLEHQHLDLICGLYPQSKVVTLLHSPKKVLGPIEQRPIRSSFLSRQFEKASSGSSPKNFLAEHPVSVLAAIRKLPISCSTHQLLNVSRGISHCYRTCEKTQVATYLMDWKCLEELTQKTLSGKLLAKYFWYQSLKHLSEQKLVLTASKSLRQDLLERLAQANLPAPMQVEVLHPYTDIDEFPMVENKEFDRNHIVLNGKNTGTEQILHVISLLDRLQLLWTLVGVTQAQEQYFAAKFPAAKIHQGICSGELFPLFASCLGAVDLSGDSFPDFSLKAMASGRPVLAVMTGLSQEFFPTDDTYVVKYQEGNLLHQTLSQWKQERLGPQLRLHRFAQGFREVYFKQRISKLLSPRPLIGAKFKPLEAQL